MQRREFLQRVAAWSAGITTAPAVFHVTPELLAAERPQPLLTVGKGKDYAALVKKVLEPLGGIGAFVKKGQSVVIKPNIGWDRKPEQAANTHPILVETLVRMALDAGASKVVVFDRSCHEARRSYASSGILEAVNSVKKSAVSCPLMEERRYVPVKIKNGKAVSEWSFYKDAMEADCYINVPIAKHHRLAKLTIGLKNIMGVIGGNRGDLHRVLGQSIADLNTVVRPALTIVDATRILLRNGPVGGKLEDVKVLDTLIASRDVVAADAYATGLFDGLAPGDIDAIRAAHGLGLGEMDLKRVKIVSC